MASGSSWLIVAAMLGQGSMLFANLIVANLLGVADYGHYALLQNTVVLLAGLAQLGFASVIAQQVSSLRERDPALAGEIAMFCFLVAGVLSLVFTGALLLSREQLAAALFRDASLASGLALGALALPFVAASAIQQGLFSGLERFRDQALLSVLLVPAVVALPALGAWRGGMEGALLGLGLAYVLRAAAAHVLVRRAFRAVGIRWRLRNLRARARLVRDYAVPATLAGVVMLAAIWGGQTLLARSPGGAAALGLFAAAFAVRTIVMFVPTQMVGALLPVLARMTGTGRAGGRRLVVTSLGLGLAVILPVAGAGILFAPWVMGIFGPDFAAGAPVLAILLAGTPVETATLTLYQDIQARGRFWRAFLSISVPLAATVLAAALLLVPAHMANGLALAWVIGWAVALVGTLVALRASPPDPAGAASA